MNNPEEDIANVIKFLGEDCTREGLLETPKRVVKAYVDMTCGYKQDPYKILNKIFNSSYDEMIIVKNIPYVSLCEHHMMPFWGFVTTAYIPNKGKIVGLSKIPRLVQCLAKRLQIQERFTHEIAHVIQSCLQPLGVGVITTGTHSCMKFRGVQSDGEMTTSCLTGVIKDKPEARTEFLTLAERK